MKLHIIGLFIGIGITYYAAVASVRDSGIYLDVLSFLIVFGGSLSVAIMTNGLSETIKIFTLCFKVFSSQKYSTIKVIAELVDLSKKYHYGKFNQKDLKEDEYHPFVMDGLRLLHNKFDDGKVKVILLNSIRQRHENNEESVNNLEALAKYPPAFGMMGTILGLVVVLKNLNAPDQMSLIGPSMAVALLTTLYGILLSNYVLQPMSDNLYKRGIHDTKIRQIIGEGIVLIAQGNDPIYIREVLLSFLSPTERKQFYKLGNEASQFEVKAA
jgi:chemotaxis protein MotA